MPNLYEQYELDPVKRKTGVPIEFNGCTFICKFAGSGNRAFRFATSFEASSSPELAKKIQDGTDAEKIDAEDEIVMRAFYENVIVGWKDVLDRSGQPMEFTKENFVDLMTSCPMVWEYVRMEARDLENYRVIAKERVVEEVGKS